MQISGRYSKVFLGACNAHIADAAVHVLRAGRCATGVGHNCRRKQARTVRAGRNATLALVVDAPEMVAAVPRALVAGNVTAVIAYSLLGGRQVRVTSLFGRYD